MLFAGRTSCHDFLANQFRLLLSAAAYVLVEAVRRLGLAGTDMGRELCCDGAHMLRRAHEQDGICGCARGEVLRGAKLVVERHAGQERAIDVAIVDVGHGFGLTRPQRDGAAGLSQSLGQRRTPGSGADDGNAVEGGGHPSFSCGGLLWRVSRAGVLTSTFWSARVRQRHFFLYALTPAPMAAGASGSSGQRGLAAKSSPSIMPRASRSAPAHAIMAPLSVQSDDGGTARR